MGMVARGLGFGVAALVSLSLAGCMSGGTGAVGDGSVKDFILFGGREAPPLATAEQIAVDCPAVTVSDGGAALRAVAGDSIRSQISIANVARECTGRPDGSVVVKVGVQGRVLLGPGGSAGSFNAPVTFSLKRGDQVLVSRTRSTAVSIPSGSFEQGFLVVEDGLVVPAGTGEFDIEVGLGGRAVAAPRGRRKG